MTKTRNKYQISILTLLCVALFACYSPQAFSWGAKAHERITDASCDLLPHDMAGFFVAHRQELAYHSNDPDRWKKDDKSESPRHFLDIDMYGPNPFAELPHTYDAAVAKFGVETVTKRGLVTWRIDEYTRLLSDTMKSGDAQKIAQVAAALAHYIEDIHMPLHVVENYNGQLTNQKGVHQRFEIEMVDKYAAHIHLKPEMATEIADPLESAFDIVLDSYVYADNLLRADLKAKLGESEYGASYLEKLFRFSGWIAERRMSDAASATASYWYTAWFRAGKPELK